MKGHNIIEMQDFPLENVGIRIVPKTSVIALIGECIHSFNASLYQYWAAGEGGEHGYLFFPDEPDMRTSRFFDDPAVSSEHSFNVDPKKC